MLHSAPRNSALHISLYPNSKSPRQRVPQPREKFKIKNPIRILSALSGLSVSNPEPHATVAKKRKGELKMLRSAPRNSAL